MEVFLKEGFTYTPEWNGNREEKPKDQIKINFTFLSAKDLVRTYTDGEPDRAKEWLAICESVENLTATVGKEKTVVTPEGLYNIKSLYDLWYECYAAFKLEDNVSKKKFK